MRGSTIPYGVKHQAPVWDLLCGAFAPLQQSRLLLCMAKMHDSSVSYNIPVLLCEQGSDVDTVTASWA